MTGERDWNFWGSKIITKSDEVFHEVPSVGRPEFVSQQPVWLVLHSRLTSKRQRVVLGTLKSFMEKAM